MTEDRPDQWAAIEKLGGVGAIRQYVKAMPPDRREQLNSFARLYLMQGDRPDLPAGTPHSMTLTTKIGGVTVFSASVKGIAGVAITPDDISMAGVDIRLNDISIPADPAVRSGFAGLIPLYVIAIVLVILLRTAAPVAELKLPPELQALLANEPGYIALAILIAGTIIKYGKR